MRNITARLAKIISKAGVLNFTEYKHPRIGVSFYDVDFSILFNFPSLMAEVIDMLEEVIRESVDLSETDYMGGIAVKGLVFSAVLANKLKKPIVVLDRSGNKIYGSIDAGKSVLIVDDLIMTGTTVRRCITRLRREGAEVNDVVAILDRMLGGKKSIEKLGVRVHALADMKEVAEALLDLGSINREEYEVILSEILD